MSEKTTGLLVLGGVGAFFVWAARGTPYTPAPVVPVAPTRKREESSRRWTIVPTDCSGWKGRVRANDQLFYNPIRIGKTEVSVQPHKLPAEWERLRDQQTMPSTLCPFDSFMVEIRGPVGPEDFPNKDWVGSFKESTSSYGSDREYPYREPTKRQAEKQRRQAMYYKGRNIRVTRNAENVSGSKVSRILADLALKNGVRLTDVGS